MQLPPGTNTRFLSFNYDRLAANFGMAEGGKAAEEAVKKVAAIAESYYGKGMRRFGTADESSSTAFFSKEGVPSTMAVSMQHKMETLVVKTFGIPEEIRQKIEKELSGGAGQG